MSEGTGLIPGDPAAVLAQAAELRRRSDVANTAGDGLRDIDLGAWTGQAAEAFQDAFSGEPARWFNAADALGLAAEALDRYATVLAWGQAQAQEAQRQGEEARVLTERAFRGYQEAQAAGTVAAPFVDLGSDCDRRPRLGWTMRDGRSSTRVQRPQRC